MKKLSFLLLFTFISSWSFSQIPAGYYDTADGQTGYTLKTTLHNVIKGHTDNGYGALWNLYETSDVLANGKVWDMYSSCDFTFVTDQDTGTGGGTECEKFNREHSFPKSWFNSASPMYSDPFHIVPTDKKVNNVRGNYAYGETSAPSYTSSNGSKLGNNSLSGFSGTVFEPIDEYKGDFARGYFYMATRYEDIISNWENNNSNGDAMLNGTSDQVYETWALDMLISWHENDPVSQKEIDRNDAIYTFQGNRNPFIDHPEYVSCVWENTCNGASSAVVTISVSSLADFGSVESGQASVSSNYTLSGTDLTNDIVITAPSYYEVSLDNSTFSSSVTLIADTDFTLPTLPSTTVYVRFIPSSGINGAISGVIANSSTGASTKNVSVSGSESGNAAPTNELFFSEYVEPNTGNNKAFEIFNPTANTVDLSSYQVRVSHNGLGFGNDGDAYDVMLSGTLNSNDVYVVYNGDADDATITTQGDLALTFGTNPGDKVASFNGNDAIGLFKNGVLIDLIGNPTDVSSTAWDVAGTTLATADHTLIRKESINAGNITSLGSFGTDISNSEWEVLPANTFSNIGVHQFQAASVPTITVDVSLFDSEFGNVTTGGNSASSNYIISGAELTNDVVITAPSHFEISLDDITFLSGVTLVAGTYFTLPTLAGTTIYVRFSPNSLTNVVINGEITNSSTGASNKVVAVSGTETLPPTQLTLSVLALSNFGDVITGGISSSQSYTIAGSNLTSDLLISAPNEFLVSKNNIDFSTSISYTPSEVNNSTLTVFVQFSPNTGVFEVKSGDITHISANINSDVAVTGSETEFAKELASITITNIDHVYDGVGKEVIVTTNPAGLSYTLTYNSSSAVPINSGNYSVYVLIDDINYQGSASEIMVIGKASTNLTITNLSYTYDGTEKQVTVTTSPENVPVVITYNSSTSLPINAGEYAVQVDVTDSNYTGSSSATMVINQATTTFTISNLSHNYDGTEKQVSVTTSPENVPVVITYNSSTSLPINAGEYTVQVEVADANYLGSSSATMVINQATTTFTITNLSYNYDGTEKQVTVTTSPENVPVVITYNSSSSLPIDAGEYAVQAVADDSNYTGSSSVTMIIEAVEAEIVVSNLVQDYDGSPKPITVTTIPEGVSTSSVYGNSTTAPIEPGSYTVQTTITDSNYFGSSLDVLSVLSVTAIANELWEQGISIYPNPVKNMLTIKVETNSLIQFYSLQGERLGQYEIEGEKEILLDHMKPGVVIISISTSESSIITKLLIER